MRRRTAFLLAAAVALLVAAPAQGAPTEGPNAELVTATCDGVVSHVYVRGNSAWGADAAGNLNGTQYVLKEIEFRGYPGTLTTEPTTDPLFVFAKTFGNKTGLGETIHCTFREVQTDESGTVTAFGDAFVVQVR